LPIGLKFHANFYVDQTIGSTITVKKLRKPHTSYMVNCLYYIVSNVLYCVHKMETSKNCVDMENNTGTIAVYHLRILHDWYFLVSDQHFGSAKSPTA